MQLKGKEKIQNADFFSKITPLLLETLFAKASAYKVSKFPIMSGFAAAGIILRVQTEGT